MDGVQLIGISGKSGSGKDWLGTTILEPAGWTKYALAWPLKNEGMGFGFTFDEMHVTKPPEARVWMQRRGTEEGWKKFGVDYWLNIAEGWIRCLGLRRVYIPDMRFPHEAEWVKRHGGKLIRIEGRGGLGGAMAEHASETALDDFDGWDVVIDNAPGVTIGEIRRQLGYDREFDTPSNWEPLEMK